MYEPKSKKKTKLLEIMSHLTKVFHQTPKQDLISKFGMDLKRAMLLRLARKDTELYPDDPAHREKIYNKYKVRKISVCD